MSNLVDHAKKELAFLNNGDEMNQAMYNHLLHMVNEFAKEGHSGFSASYARNHLEKLLRFEPIGPLTGEPNEWNHIADNLWQNNRCSRVFMDSQGTAWDIEGKVFVELNGAAFTSSESQVPVEFPHTPQTEYVYVKEAPEANPEG
jgi:hypothetical protein